MKVWGIVNCDTVKKARAWLDARGVAYEFVDLRRTPPDRERVARWCAKAGRDVLVNRRAPTWRGLGAAERAAVVDDASAVAALLAHPTLAKRPVVEAGDEVLVGFDPDDWDRRFRRSR